MLTCPQVKTEISVESKHQTLQGLAFPLQPEAQRALQQLRQKTINYIQLVGTAPPTHAQKCTRIPPPGLSTVVPVYRWKHAVHPPCPSLPSPV